MAEITSWITDSELSPRFPFYTRANADEVGPEPFSPLGWSLGWEKGCIPGVAKGFVAFGVVSQDEFALDPPEVFGNWGGYFYNQLSLPRVMGVRMPGASAEAIDLAYFGDHPGVPDYTPHPSDESEERSEHLTKTMTWVMSAQGFPAQVDSAERAKAFVRDRPNLSSLSDAELVARARQLAGLELDAAWTAYCQSALGASLGPGAVQAICEAIGRGADAAALFSAVGGIESADAAVAMWHLSRTIKHSPELMAEFDKGAAGVLDRMRALDADDAATFLADWDQLIADFGHRGPNEWDLQAPSWTTRPSIPLGMLERLRFQSNDRSPENANRLAATKREELTVELLDIVAGDAEAHGGLQAGIASAAVFFQLRETGKNACIRLIHEAKLALYEVGERHASNGSLANSQQIFMLLDNEVDRFLDDPSALTSTLQERTESFDHLRTLEPPYIVKGDEGVPPIATWRSRAEIQTAEPAGAGDTLQGASGAPGVVTGIARVVLDPSDPGAIGPGDIMVAPTTDPSWVPLFLAAEGVVVNVGAVASHAAIMCRELGVPCAVLVIDATLRIPNGATIEIDGSTGRVTILSVEN